MTNKRRKFERNQPAIRRAVISSIGRKGGILHGARAQNAQLPRFLERKTKDYDIFVRRPQIRAKALEMKLDKLFRGDFFRVKKGKSKVISVSKVVDNINNESIVDFARPSRKVTTKVISGIRVATLKDQKDRAIKNLTDPNARFRRDKDREFLERIREFEKLRGRKL
ncbi:hypothetical protein LCGC14_1063090 [marine sediment metagenome]|uniref:Uncharacterized protein n=1 Tax=marine sediment metagenome TaxID=412755 RepID=A0A0F9Q3K5_9ZZZZ